MKINENMKASGLSASGGLVQNPGNTISSDFVLGHKHLGSQIQLRLLSFEGE
jgi:hypothetical protein